ncbi:AraC family transcriptional regulator [Microbacterium sp. 77mftsu3.1]|uniref:AraC family transcriptional regulator n=1 Tax=Microbacterium sp. 77mftsu3.1 TaxID=1761802 RepID=UPI000361FBBF|nr:AraC family transcriptional regulator [Microbacterium sp. 77mftsu3.1]SDG32872.1 AraC-type DNA-binding protein [Microbacterium sp. 77mftsu3.1]
MDERTRTSLDRAADRVRRHIDRVAAAESLGLILGRTTAPSPTMFVQYKPCVSVVLTGRKVSGDDSAAGGEWGPERFLITPVDLPLFARVSETGPAGDFVSVNWRIDPAVVAEVAGQLPLPAASEASERLGTMTAEIADVVDRMLALLDAPAEAGVLAPLLNRELIVRLLQSDQAARVLAAATHANADIVTAAITTLTRRLAEPWTLDAIAASVGASPTTVSRRFRELTGLTPMRYLKRLRLGEARRLLITDGDTAAQAGAAVGYVSASHFSRDYRSAYGRSPASDATDLRERMRAS